LVVSGADFLSIVDECSTPGASAGRLKISSPLIKERYAISKTGTGFAGAKLSAVLPPLALLRSSG